MANNNNNQVNIRFNAFNADFNKAIKGMNQESARLRQEFKLQQEQMKNNSTQTERMEVKLQSLSDQYEVAKKSTQETAKQLERVREIWGENSEEAQRLETQLRNMQIAEQKLANSITDTRGAIEKQERAQSNLSNLMEVSGRSISEFADIIGTDMVEAINNGTANAKDIERAFSRISREVVGVGTSVHEIQQILNNLNGNNLNEVRADLNRLSTSLNDAETEASRLENTLNDIGSAVAGAAPTAAAFGIVEGTEEANRALAMLEVQLDKAKLSLEDIGTARTALGATGHDVNQITESMGNLIQAGYTSADSINGISKVLAGARIEYGETFSAEGLAESITTTTQLGEVTGQLTDLLEKEGISVDDFNAKMQSMSSITERANYITQLLAGQGLAESYDKFEKENQALVDNMEAKQELERVMTDLADAVAPLVTSIMNLITPIIQLIASNPILVQIFTALAMAIGGLTAAFSTISIVAGAVTKLLGGGAGLSGIMAQLGTFLTTFASKVLPLLMRGFSLLTGPVGWFITAATLIITYWDPLKEFFSGFFEFTANLFAKIKDALAKPFQDAKKIYFDILDGLKEKFSTVSDWISQKISSVLSGIGNMFKAPVNVAIKALNYLIRALNKVQFDVPDWVPVIGGGKFGFHLKEVDYFANGGILNGPTLFGFNGGTPMVGGEAGREAVLPLRADVLAGIGQGIVAATGMGAQTIIHNYERMLEGAVFHVRTDDDIRAIARALHDYNQRQQRGG